MTKKIKKIKTREEIFNQLYLTPRDIKEITGVGIGKATNIAKTMCKKMKEKKIFDPSEPMNWDEESKRQYLVNTDFFRKEMRL